MAFRAQGPLGRTGEERGAVAKEKGWIESNKGRRDAGGEVVAMERCGAEQRILITIN